MRIKDVNPEAIAKAQANISKKLSQLKEKVARLKQQIFKLKKQCDPLERGVVENDFYSGLLAQTALLRCGVGETVATLRQNIFALKALALRDDITVAEVRQTHEKIKTAIAEIQSQCAHLLIFGHYGYSSLDPDDGYIPGSYACAVCGLKEREKNNTMLVVSKRRLFFVDYSDPDRFGKLYTKLMDADLDEVIAYFTDSRVFEIIEKNG